MAVRSKLTVESLTKLGAKRLAEILIEEAGRNRQLKQAVQMALAAETGRPRLATRSASGSLSSPAPKHSSRQRRRGSSRPSLSA